MSISRLIDDLHVPVARATKGFVESRLGKLFLAVILVGPFTFLPTVWEAWTAPNIDVLRTPTWPCMTIINFAAWISLAHNGDWRMRLVGFMWVLMMVAVTLAIYIR